MDRICADNLNAWIFNKGRTFQRRTPISRGKSLITERSLEKSTEKIRQQEKKIQKRLVSFGCPIKTQFNETEERILKSIDKKSNDTLGSSKLKLIEIPTMTLWKNVHPPTTDFNQNKASIAPLSRILWEHVKLINFDEKKCRKKHLGGRMSK